MRNLLAKLVNNTQLKAFLAVGGVVNLIGVSIYYLITEFFNVNHNVCVTMLFFVGTSLSYYLNARYAFNSTRYSNVELVKFFVIYFAALLIQNAIVYIGVRLPIHGTLVYVFSIGVTTIFNFLLLRLFVFNRVENA